MAQFNSSLLTTRPTYMVDVSILSLCLFPLTPSQGTMREEWNPEPVGQTAPDRIFVLFFFVFFVFVFVFVFSFSSHATSWHKANSPDTAPYRFSTDFSIFPLHHLVAQSRSPRHTAQSVSDRFFLSCTTSWYILFLFCLFFSFYTTSWRRAEVPDTLLKQSPTDLYFLFLSYSYTTSWHIFLFFCLHHLVAQSRSFRGIAKMVHNDYEAR